jgi:2-polyprenyl-6-methoxyphenol hydroxylase-like FAD-dependent oxidoreductase/protein-disulfide isomerase-like protein with CxxC motif
MKRLRLIYFTDPICSTCWLAEPYLYRLKKIWGDSIFLEIRMGGLLPSLEEAQKNESVLSNIHSFISQLSELSKLSGMHLDGSFWEHSPVSSSYPSSIAYHAVKLSSPELAANYLRTLREMVYTENKDISNVDWLDEAAIRNKINLEDFHSRLIDGSAEIAFQRDLMLKDELGVRRFPTLIFEDDEGQRIIENQAFKSLHGNQILVHWNETISRMLNLPVPTTESVNHTAEISSLLCEFESLTTAELAIMLGENETQTLQMLEIALQAGRVQREVHQELSIWRKNEGVFRWEQNEAKLKNTAIVGAGIAGMALAIGLKKAGIGHTIFERSRSNTKSGFGFLILENGFKALESLGLKTQFLKFANPICTYRALAPDGSLLRHKALEKCYAISRRDLLGILNSELTPNLIQYEKTLRAIHQIDSSVHVQFGQDSIQSFEALFACDGFHSEIRSNILPEFKPQSTSEKELVCLVDATVSDFRLIEFTKIIDSEQRCNTGIVPLRNGQMLWFMQLNDEVFPLEQKDSESLYKLACEISAHYPKPVRDLIQIKSKNVPIYLWNSNRMDLMPSFHKGNICFLGDAAHPLLAFTSQGANSALEDAVTLASLLSKADSKACPKEIYLKYYQKRQDFISTYIMQGDEMLEEFLSIGTQGAETIPLAIH